VSIQENDRINKKILIPFLFSDLLNQGLRTAQISLSICVVVTLTQACIVLPIVQVPAKQPFAFAGWQLL
jgi:hypothetical protein